MKKSLIVLATLGAFAGAASAQSSVTLFGVVDLSANSIKNGSTTVKRMDNNQLNSNRLGFRGTEDLGGGMTAGFWIEGSLSNDDGGTGLDFKRRSTVSLSGGFGEVRLGRDYTVNFLAMAGNDAYGANGFATPANVYASDTALLGFGAASPTTGLRATGATTVRANNMATYFLPGNLGGIYGSLQIAAGEGTDSNKFQGGRLGYAAGPVDVTVAYSQTGEGTKLKDTTVGGSYNFGVAKLYAFYDQKKLGANKYVTYSVSTAVPLGQGEFRLAYSKGNRSGGTVAENDSDSTLFGAEYIYNLSKRTALYAQYGKLKNNGSAQNSVVLGAGSGAAGNDSTGYGAGIRHSF